MADRWIMDVLADLRNFARNNGLPRLEEALDDTALVAVAELEDRPDRNRSEGIVKI